MQIGKYDSRIVLEGVEHAIAVMRIDVDIGHARHAAVRAQCSIDHAAIVEHAEAGGAPARGMVQAADRHEGAPARAVEYPLGRRQAGADHAGGGLEHAAKGGRVAAVQPAVAGLRALHDEADVLGRVKQLQLAVQRIARLEHADPRVAARAAGTPAGMRRAGRGRTDGHRRKP